MADARALLRQQRAARRVNHPYAVYSDTGKLSCAVCRETVRSEAAWADHVRGVGHRQNARVHETGRKTTTQGDLAPTLAQPQPQPQKRKHEDSEDDVHMSDEDAGDDGNDGDGSDSGRRKRNRSGKEASTTSSATAMLSQRRTPPQATTPRTGPLARRTSGTPQQGIELQIPSRPATPTSRNGSGGGGDSFWAGSANGSLPSGVSTLKSASSAGPSFVGASTPATTTAKDGGSGVAKAANAVDEDEWAAFEAEVVNAAPETISAPETTTAKTAPRTVMDSAAVISAAPVSVEKLAAEGEQQGGRRGDAEAARIAEEEEEAKRALEAEFEDMEALEQRVRRLKEKREELRRQSQREPETAAAEQGKQETPSKEEDDDDEDEDDAAEDEDDWGVFRFRA